jgi:hypothetical protein
MLKNSVSVRNCILFLIVALPLLYVIDKYLQTHMDLKCIENDSRMWRHKTYKMARLVQFKLLRAGRGSMRRINI